MTAAKSVRVKIIEALLKGRELNATAFTREIGACDRTVRRELHSLGDAVNVRHARGEPGKHRLYYSARDPIALRDLIRERHEPQFGALLRAWGIAARDLALPKREHRIATKEDGPEPILV